METAAPATNPPIVLSDGTIEFAAESRSDGTKRQHKIDLTILQLTCDECLTAHNLQIVDGRYKSTSAFLLDLANRLSAVGIEGCTPSLAAQLWAASYEGFESLKKSMNGTPNSPSGTESTPEDSPQPKNSDGTPISNE